MMAEDRLELASSGPRRSTALRFRRVAALGSAGAALVALAGLLGYVPGLRVLGSLRSDYIPMAPSTAGCFLILSAASFRHARTPWQSSRLMVMVALVLLVPIVGLLTSVEYFLDIDFTLDDMLSPGAGTLGEIPVGRMSPFTGGAFVAAGLGTCLLLARSWSSRHARRLGHWASSLGILTVLIGATVLLTYLYGAPIGYGGTTVPMAATTALAFVLLGAAGIAAAGPQSLPMRLVIGESTSARLSRVFLPLMLAVVLVQSFVSRLAPASFAGHDEVFLAILVVLAGMITASVVARVAHSIGNHLDESNRKLQESEAQNRALVSAIPDLIFTNRRDGECLAVHAPDQRALLALSETFLHRRVEEVLPQPVADQLTKAFADALDSDEVQEVHYSLTARGQETHFEARVVSCTEDSVISIVRDISERKQAEVVRAALEVQLRESQKMEAIGTLAGGIAHDFNNILAIILGNAELAREEVGAQPLALENLEEIIRASVRARGLVQQILSFSRRRPSERKVTYLEAVIDESVRLLRATLPARLTLEVHCDADVPAVLADATQIQQVVINLATNAMQAMRSGPGRIDIRLDSVLLDDALAAAHPALGAMHARRPGRTVRIAVTDTGPGMDAATLARIFEPFFTTRAVGAGTGLGLSVVHGILRAHEGEIEVDSQPGQGASFAIYLPAAAAQAVAPEAEPGAGAPTATADQSSVQHILYLDDEPSLVLLVQRQLARRGYRVAGFTKQAEALAALRAEPAAFDLVVTDYNMPGISGLDVAREVRAIRADLPVMVVSGHVDETLLAEAAGAGVRELILKANGVDELCAALARLAQTVVENENSS